MSTNIQENKHLKDWQTLPVFLENNPQFSKNQIRWLLLNRKTNGLSECTRKIGKPIYINIPKFLIWLDSYTER